MPMFERSSSRGLVVLAGAAMLAALPGFIEARNTRQAGPKGSSAYEQAVLASTPAAYWHLGELGGSRARDTTGHRHDGRYVGHPHLGQPGAITGDPDQAIGLDGPRTKSYVAIADHDDFSIVTGGKGLTVEVWMRPDVRDFDGEKANSPDDFIHWLGKGEKG
jgi:hypothetical protein